MIITLDFETYYDKDYGLRKMSTIDYIRDHRFQTIMCAVKVNQEPSEIFVGRDAVAARFAQIDWTKAAMLAHNTAFDGAILAWHYGIYPKMYLDTLSMARATVNATTGRCSLEKVSEYLGLPPKGKDVHNALGLRLEHMSPVFLRGYSDYCLRDNDNCRMIFDRLRRAVPLRELILIDQIISMFTTPQVKLNPHVLAEHKAQVEAEAAAHMAKVAHIDKSVFSSNQQFAALLESMGVEVPMKKSPTTGTMMPALAKNDREFKELCVDEEQPLAVQAILAARVSAKSTIEGTRTQKMLDLSLKDWGHYGSGWAPVPLKYWGAHTGRLSGDGGFNWQNFKRGSRIREAIEAPEGMRILHRDASQIEARMLAWLAGCEKLVRAFREGRDVYSEFASVVYDRKVTKADKPGRFVGKTCILGLGYQTGGAKLRHTLFIGNGGVSVQVTEQEATNIVYAYRRQYPEIPDLWMRCQTLLEEVSRMSGPFMQGARRRALTPYALEIFPVVRPGVGAVWLPNDMCIAYPKLRHRRVTDPTGRPLIEFGYVGPYGENDFRHMYGGKGTENICQALCRIIVTDIAARVKHQTGYNPFLSTHDSLDYCVPVSEAADMDKLLDAEFAVVPPWCQGLPLASEGGFGRNLLIAEDDKHSEHNQ